MRKLRVVIADDEPLALKLLQALLEKMPDVDVIAQCRNGREVIDACHELAPDLMILDIQMPQLNGFEVVKELQSDSMPLVIFCTAYQRYALDAFDLHAVDYILKPVSETRLQRAVSRALERLQDNSDGAEQKSPVLGAIDEIAQKVSGRAGNRSAVPDTEQAQLADRKIAIKDHESTVLVDIDDIDWIDAAGDYMCIHVKGETLILRSTLKHLMSKLDPDLFKRIHRSTVVNLTRIVKSTPLHKGEYMLFLECGAQLKVSRNFRQDIKVFLSER